PVWRPLLSPSPHRTCLRWHEAASGKVTDPDHGGTHRSRCTPSSALGRELGCWTELTDRTLEGCLARSEPDGGQQVTWRIAFVSPGCSFSVSIAAGVLRRSSSTLRRLASRFTSFITGRAPFPPVPITSRRHFQGIFSLIESGVWPYASRNGFEGFLLRSRILPRSITTSRP